MKRIPLGILVTAVLALFAPLAAAQIVIVTSADGRIGELSRQQAEQLYLGRTRSLPAGAPVALAALPAGRLRGRVYEQLTGKNPPGPGAALAPGGGASARDRFYEQLTGKNPSQIRAYWSRMVFTGRALPPQQAENVRELGARLMTDPNLIGYLSAADADPRLKVLLKLP